jgi:hypothetical protein
MREVNIHTFSIRVGRYQSFLLTTIFKVGEVGPVCSTIFGYSGSTHGVRSHDVSCCDFGLGFFLVDCVVTFCLFL